MSLDLQLVKADVSVQQAFDLISAQFPISGANTASPTVTSFPTSPVNGQEVSYLADSTNGVVWTFKYRSAATTYKWEFVGGSPLVATPIIPNCDAAGESTAATHTTFQDVMTVGPTTTLPALKGIFVVRFGGNMYTLTNAGYGLMTLSVGGSVAAGNTDAFLAASDSGGNSGSSGNSLVRQVTTAANSAVIKCQYRSGGAYATFWRGRWMETTPIAVI